MMRDGESTDEGDVTLQAQSNMHATAFVVATGMELSRHFPPKRNPRKQDPCLEEIPLLADEQC